MRKTYIVWIQVEMILFGVLAVGFNGTLECFDHKRENVTATKLSLQDAERTK